MRKTSERDATRQPWRLVFQHTAKTHYVCILRDDATGRHSVAAMQREGRQWRHAAQIFEPGTAPYDALAAVAREVRISENTVSDLKIRAYIGIIPA